MTTTGTTVQRLLDHLEHLLWDAQDRRLRAAGFEVTRIGRWRRSYRHPSRLAAVRAAREAAARPLARSLR
jgi:hypothetical protein